jgi:uncharacterized OB-fold protein
MNHITAYKCKNCGWIMYPKHFRCPNCREREFDEMAPSDEASLLTYTVLNELPWGIDERGRVLGIVQFTNGVKAMGLIEADENGVKIGMKLKAGWKPVRVIGGERVYGLTFQPTE